MYMYMCPGPGGVYVIIAHARERVTTFKKETRLEVFSVVYEVQSVEENEIVALEISKHNIDWATATLEDQTQQCMYDEASRVHTYH